MNRGRSIWAATREDAPGHILTRQGVIPYLNKLTVAE
jgi:hypothetical protein